MTFFSNAIRVVGGPLWAVFKSLRNLLTTNRMAPVTISWSPQFCYQCRHNQLCDRFPAT